VRFYIGITNRDWFDHVSHIDGVNEVNFWQPGGNVQFRSLQPGRHADFWGVNEQQFSIPNLRQAIQDAEKSTEPIKLLLKRGNAFITVRLEYHDGLRYPYLERVDPVQDRIDAVVSPLK